MRRNALIIIGGTVIVILWSLFAGYISAPLIIQYSVSAGVGGYMVALITS